MCLLCTPDKYVPEDLVKKSIAGKVLIALNVQHDPSGRTFVADRSRKGNHWALLALDTEIKCAYYGDSLGWAIPSNLETMVEPLLKKVGLSLEPFSINECKSMKLFYLRQTSSNMCGVIVLCMAAVMSCEWDQWLEWNADNVPVCLQLPSEHSKHLRLNVILWLIEDRVDLSSITKHKQVSCCTITEEHVEPFSNNPYLSRNQTKI